MTVKGEAEAKVGVIAQVEEVVKGRADVKAEMVVAMKVKNKGWPKCAF